MNDNAKPLARVIAFPTRKAVQAPMTCATESLPHTNATDQTRQILQPRPIRIVETVTVETQRPLPYVRVAAIAASISVISLVIGGLIGPAVAVYVGTLLSFVAMIAAHGLNIRQRNLRLERMDREEVDPRPLAMLNPANLCKMGVGWYAPHDDDNEDAKRTLLLMAPSPCHPLGQVAKATFKSERVPAGIRYETVKFVPKTKDGTAILCLRLFDDDRFGRKYHDKLRDDLLCGDTDMLDAELELADGRRVTLTDIDRFRQSDGPAPIARTDDPNR